MIELLKAMIESLSIWLEPSMLIGMLIGMLICMLIGMLIVATLFVKNLVYKVYDEQTNELDPDYVKAMNTLNGVSEAVGIAEDNAEIRRKDVERMLKIRKMGILS